MSVDASKWALMADVKKSSSKLVLLTLAQFVRYDSDDWTAFCSVQYLSSRTHLNRKTVLEALARLRGLGAIQDTGRRAGANNSCPVYRLCRHAVDLIIDDRSQRGSDLDSQDSENQSPLDFSGTAWPAAPSGGRPVPIAGDAARFLRCIVGDMGIFPNVPAENDEIFGCEDDAAEADACEIEAASAPVGEVITLPTRVRPAAHAAAVAKATTRRGCVEGSRLPEHWHLPARWRSWTTEIRPLWTPTQIDALATTFHAYFRSLQGDAGQSPDWFAKWRLWVLREKSQGDQGESQAWTRSWKGIQAQGRRLGLVQLEREPDPEFRLRVHRAAGVPLPHALE